MKKSLKNFCFFLLSYLVTSCSFFEGQFECTFNLAYFPPHWEKLASYYPLGKLLIVAPHTEPSVFRIDSHLKSFKAPLTKKRQTLILYYPFVEGETALVKPLGAIFPFSFDLSAEQADLTSYAGFVAERLLKLNSQQIDYTAFNTERLISLLESKATDPYLYDYLKIETDIASGVFNYYSLKKRPTRSLSLILPSGNWFLDNHFSNIFISDNKQACLFENLTYDLHIILREEDGFFYFLKVQANDYILFSK